MAGGGPESSGHVAGELGVTPARWIRGGVSNAGSSMLGCGKGCDNGVEDVLEKLWAEQLGSRRDVERWRSRRTAAEFAEDEGRGERPRWGENERLLRLGVLRGVKEDASGLTGGVAVDVRPTSGQTHSGARRLCLTESLTEPCHRRDWNRNFADVLLVIYSVVLAQICSIGQSYASTTTSV